jgi:CheY-like chemotaxis protein
MHQASVFLVEDEPLIGMMLADMIEQLGHRVVAEASNIQVGQTLAQSANYDLALLDINIGGHCIDPVAEIIDRRAATDRAADPNNSVTGLCCRSP